MPEAEEYHAQLVMRREDGASILDATGPRTGGAAGSHDVSEARAAGIRRQLETLGFQVTTGNLNTLSISGPRDRFETVFGLEAAAGAKGVAAHATKIPQELADSVADVFVPPAPQLYP